MEDLRAKPFSDAVVYGVSQHRSDEQQRQNHLHRDKLLGSQRPDSKKERIARQKWSHDQPCLTENDEKQQDVNQHSIVLDHPLEVILGVQKKLDELLQDLHDERLPNATQHVLGRKFSTLPRLQSRGTAAKQP